MESSTSPVNISYFLLLKLVTSSYQHPIYPRKIPVPIHLRNLGMSPRCPLTTADDLRTIIPNENMVCLMRSSPGILRFRLIPTPSPPPHPTPGDVRELSKEHDAQSSCSFHPVSTICARKWLRRALARPQFWWFSVGAALARAWDTAVLGDVIM